MWKFIIRGIRESFERRACRTNVCSQSTDGGSNDQNQVAIRPKNSVVSTDFYLFIHTFCNNNAKNLGTKDKENYNKYDPKYTWTNAVGLSSIIAVGYVFCQSLWARRNLFEFDRKNFEKLRIVVINSPSQASRLFENTFAVSPNYKRRILSILPLDQEASENKDTQSLNQVYGPLTAEETYKEAEDELIKTHNSIMSELELNSGIIALEEERYTDAIEHFTEGAKLASPSNIFNLALCYELGLGTSINYEKAAELYRHAADYGHVDAMYNLGVFHAQGKGGLRTNLNVARQLFSTAAEKGHIQASEALELEKSYIKHPTLQENLTVSSKNQLEVKTLGRNAQNLTVKNLTNHKIFKESKNRASYKFFNSINKNMDSRNDTDYFLNLVGHFDRNVISRISIGDTRS